MPIEEYYVGLLKPCPNCGQEASLPYRHYNESDYWCVECRCGTAKAIGPTLLSSVVMWQNLCVPKNKRIPIACPVCGSGNVECDSFTFEKKTAFYCECLDCKTTSPYVYSNKFEALSLFLKIVNFGKEKQHCSVAVEVGYKAIAVTLHNNVFWDVEATEKAICIGAKEGGLYKHSCFWNENDKKSDSVQIYKYLGDTRYPERSKLRKWPLKSLCLPMLATKKYNNKQHI